MITSILTYLLTVVEVLCSILLIAAILIQKTKGQGVGLAIGGGMGETLFGSQAGNVMTKATVTLGAIFLLNTTVLAVLGSRRRETSVTDAIPAAPAAVPAPVRAATGPGTGLPVEGFPSGAQPQPADFGQPITGGEAPAGTDAGTAPTPPPVEVAPSEPAPSEPPPMVPAPAP